MYLQLTSLISVGKGDGEIPANYFCCILTMLPLPQRLYDDNHEWRVGRYKDFEEDGTDLDYSIISKFVSCEEYHEKT